MSSASHSLAGQTASRRRRAPRPPMTLDLFSHWVSMFTVVVGFFLAAAIAGLALYGYSHSDRYYEGMSVAGVPVGGMTQSEARAKLRDEFETYLNSTIQLTSGDQTFPLRIRDAGIDLDLDVRIASSFGYARGGSWWPRSRAWAHAVTRGRDLPLVIRVNGSTLDDTIAQLAPAVTR